MKKATRKIYLSILFVALSLLTMVATTFAWVGIVSNASFERFTVNLETDNEESEYGVMLSLTGKQGDFHDSIDALDLQKQILLNMGVPAKQLNSETNIKSIFNAIRLPLCTTKKIGSGSSVGLDTFTGYNGEKTTATYVGRNTDYKGYFEFDVWITIYRIGENAFDSENKLLIFLKSSENESILSSQYNTISLSNAVVFPNTPTSSQYLNAAYGFYPGMVVSGKVTINPANATRLSVQKAKSVKLYDYKSYGNYDYTGLKIFKTGSDLPKYDSRYNYYDFGGILPSDSNFARLLYNSVRAESEWIGEVPDAVLPENRGDITFADDGVNNKIVDSSDNVTTSDMIKLHFSFWFEGWDADCFEAINDQMVSVNLSFSTKNAQ